MAKIFNGGDCDYKVKDRELINMPMLTENNYDVKINTNVNDKPLGLRRKAVIMQVSLVQLNQRQICYQRDLH